MTTSQSWLRVTVFQLPADQDSGEEFVRSSVDESSRVLKSQPGYAGGYWGDSPADRTFGAVLHWSSLQAIEDATVVLDQLKARRAGQGFPMLDVRNIQLYAVWREARQQSDSEGGGRTRPIERPLFLPSAALVAGHPHQVRSRPGADDVTVDTRLRIQYFRVDHPDQSRSLDYFRSAGPEARALLQAQPGFRLGYVGHIQGTGGIAVITYWADQRALEGAEPAFTKLLRERGSHGITLSSVRNFRLFALPAGIQPELAGASV
jgi:hypothetical protein